MNMIRRRIIRSIAVLAAINLSSAAVAVAQPLLAAVSVASDTCVDPAQSSCSSGLLQTINGATQQVDRTMYLWRGVPNTSLWKLLAHPGGALVFAAQRFVSGATTAVWIDVIDIRTSTKVNTYAVSGNLAAISPDGRRLYLTSFDALSVLVIDSATGAAVSTVPVSQPSAVAASPDGTRLYVVAGTALAQSIVVLDAGTYAQIASIPLPQVVSQLEFTTDGGHLFALAPTSRVFRVDPLANAIVGAITDFGGPSSPNHIATGGGRLYVAASFQSPGVAPGEGIAAIDVTTGSFLGKAPLLDPIRVEVSTDGSRVWGFGLGSPRLYTIDAATTTVIGNLPTGSFVDLEAIPPLAFADVVIDQPAANAVVQQPFNISGWAVDASAGVPGTGVSTVHVWAFPANGTSPTFVGADYGRPRPDVGAFLGPSFTNSGYIVTVRGLQPGDYQLVAFALSVRTGQFSIARNVPITIRSGAQLAVDTPRTGSSVPSRFVVAGWALDTGAATGSGVDVVHVWAYPDGGAPMLLGAATLGDPRPDVGAYFGAQFGNAGYHLEVPNLAPGSYTLIVYARSTVTNTISVEQHLRVTVAPRQPLIWIDAPAPAATVGTTFIVSGWALELNAAAGTGVDLVHIWATSSSGAATYLGAVTYGINRPDVGAWLGPQYAPSGFSIVASLPPGSYTLSVYARSTETGTFRYWKTVQIVVQ